ncbi:hypothetical protein H9L39_14761, partial [Fusarium oxysporum f. sp. albedinis]
YHQPEELPRYTQPAFPECGDPENIFDSSLINIQQSTLPSRDHAVIGKIILLDIIAGLHTDMFTETSVHDLSSTGEQEAHRFAIFFEQWAPFFPVLHEPTAFGTYREFVNGSGNTKNKHTLAQIYLIVDIAGQSCQSPDLQQHSICKKKWQEALNAIAFDKDHIAIDLSNYLGLHKKQGDIRLDCLTNETRKRIFWTLYTLDCFSASRLKTSMLLKDTEITIDYPGDIDGEHIAQHALFRAARVLAKALDERYSDVDEFISERMTAIEGELDAWLIQIPRHLELEFIQDKCPQDVENSRPWLLTCDRRSIGPWIERQIRDPEGYSYRCRMKLDQNIFPFDDFKANSSTGAPVFVPGRRCNIFVTPLSAATYLGNVRAVKYFLQFPDPHENNGLISPLSLACLQGHSHIIQLLAERNESGNTLNTAHMAARTGQSHFIYHLYHKFYLQGACDVDSIPPAIHALYLDDDEKIKDVFSTFIGLDRDALDTLGI